MAWALLCPIALAVSVQQPEIGGMIILVCMVIWAGYMKYRRATKKTINIVRENCVGCKHCVEKCRHDVLEVVQTPEGPRVEVKDPERCKACGHCVAACPFHALQLIEKGCENTR